MNVEEAAGPCCEACRSVPAAVCLDSDDPAQPYLLCSACAEHLTRKALRPLEWFNLAAAHGWRKYLLRDDFYDQDGVAFAPEMNGYSASERPAPSLEDVTGSLERLIDYCMTRWSIEMPAFEAFVKFPTSSVLKEFDRRIAVGNCQVLETCLTICANALGKQAALWVRQQYRPAIEARLLVSWAEAAARCLPHPEGMQMVIQALGELDTQALRDRKMALMWFRSPEVLDWIEIHIPNANITEDWGRLAALSAFDWSRAQKWLRSGRPLSLAAIDALAVYIQRPGQAPVIGRLNPTLQGCGDRSEIREALQLYQAVDDTPRTELKSRFIIEHLDELRLA